MLLLISDMVLYYYIVLLVYILEWWIVTPWPVEGAVEITDVFCLIHLQAVLVLVQYIPDSLDQFKFKAGKMWEIVWTWFFIYIYIYTHT